MRSAAGRRQARERSTSGPRGALSLSRGLARGRARKSWPPVSGTGGAGGQSPAGHVHRPSVPAEPPAGGVHLSAVRDPAPPPRPGSPPLRAASPSRGRNETCPADVPGAPSTMPPQLTPLGGAVRYPARRERGGQHRARRGHCGGTGTTGGDEQARFPALPRDRHPSSGHPLPDMPHRTIAYQPGQASDALTGHYRQAHPATPGLPCSR